jgi:hypothetical protein
MFNRGQLIDASANTLSGSAPSFNSNISGVDQRMGSGQCTSVSGTAPSIVYFWNRALSDAEMALVDADPYAILVPAYQESLPVIAVVSGGAGVDHLAAAAAGVATGTANLDLQHHLAAAAASIASATAGLDLQHHLSAAASSIATAFAALDVQSAGTSHLAGSATGAATASAALRVQHHLAAATSALAFASASMDVQHHLAAAASSVAAATAALTTLSVGSHLAADAHSVSSATAALDIIRAPVPNQIRSAIARQRVMAAPYM